MHDPQLIAQSQPQDPSGPWQSRNPFQGLTISTGTDHTGRFTRSDVVDGQIVGIRTGEETFGSTRYADEAQNRDARLPFDYAVDPRTQCRVSPHDLKEDTIVYFGDTSLTIAQARQIGLLSPDWRVPGSQPQEVLAQRSATAETTLRAEARARQEGAEPPPELQGEAFTHRAADEELTSIVNNTGGVEQMAAIQEIIETGSLNEHTVGTLATQMAMEPEALLTKFEPIMAAFTEQGRAVFTQGGVDADEAISWAQDNRPDALQRAMHLHATQRSTRGYAALRNEFLANLGESNPQRALAADLGQGITTYLDKGRVVVRLPNGDTMLWKTAIEAFGPR